MASPFPGMDPYLEKHWGDVHHCLITYARDQLQPGLPEGLRARVEERVLVEPDVGRPRSIFPDVRVVEHASGPARIKNGTASTAVAEPLLIELPSESETQGFIEIRDMKAGGRVVTVLEVLSPSNKYPGEGQEQYLRKQRELVTGRVSLVEIDLLRAGDWVLAMPYDKVRAGKRATYRVVVRRGWEPNVAEYYPAPLTAPLPVIKVPLRRIDTDVSLDLQALVDQCYRNGAYDDIDYARAPEPPLAPADARWAARLLRKLGRRTKPRTSKKK